MNKLKSKYCRVSFFILLCLLPISCLKDDELNVSLVSHEPKELADGITISSPAAESMMGVQIDRLYQDIYKDENLWSLRSLLIFRDGKLISEAYLKDEKDIINKHIVWSCTKQVMGILTGIALDNGLVDNIDDPISAYLGPELNDHLDKGNITIRDLLTMQSGIDYDNEVQTDDILKEIPVNSVDFVLSRPITSAPGELFRYNDGNPHLLSAIIQNLTDQPADVYAEQFLFSKIEVTNYHWVRYKDGITLGGFGIETTPRELAKIALCVANEGNWKGRQIVSSSWIHAMTHKEVDIENSAFAFGYFWWIDEARDIHFMWGVGGQFAFIVPSKNLVIVMTSFPNTKGEFEIQAEEALEIVDRIILAAN